MNRNIKRRDISLIETDTNKILIACDSFGSIGLKENDKLKISPEISGYYLARVPFAELISINAIPSYIIVNSSAEKNPTTDLINNGIKRAMKEIELNLDIITGSTEENFLSTMTAAGLTALSIKEKDYKFPVSKSSYTVYLIGKAYIGEEVLKNKDNIITLKDLINIRNNNKISEILPVGSKGIKNEIEQLSSSNNLNYNIFNNINEDIEKSCGPSSAFLITSKYNDLNLEYFNFKKIAYLI